MHDDISASCPCKDHKGIRIKRRYLGEAMKNIASLLAETHGPGYAHEFSVMADRLYNGMPAYDDSTPGSDLASVVAGALDNSTIQWERMTEEEDFLIVP